MKQLLAALLGLLFVSSPINPQKPVRQSATHEGREAASAELVALTNSWTDAINAKDHVKLEALLGPEFALYRWNGELLAPRSDWLDFLYHAEIKEYTVRDISAKAYGDFGVVTSVCTWAGVGDGRPFNVHSVMVDTWRRTNKKWQVEARSSCTPTPESAGTSTPCPVYHY